MPDIERAVFIVDDDAGVRDSIGLLLSLYGYRTAFFASATAFLKAWLPEMQGCLLIDIRMPEMDGLTLQRALHDRGCHMPVIIITGHGDVDSARAAFRSHAVDYLEKPLHEDQLIKAVEEAFRHISEKNRSGPSIDYRRRYATLTPREREVMELVVAGRHNREIAELLGISVRTVEVHKARVMQKIEVTTLADLVRLHLQNAI
jgi:FixJ family two-component response regulator